MKRSYLAAGGLALVAVVWVATGTVRSGGDAAPEVAAVTKARDAAPVAVRVTRIQAETRPREISVMGRTEPDRTAEVKVETAGRIVETPLEKGARVKAGDVIAKLAVDDRPAALAAAQAEVNSRQIAYDAARKLSQKEYRSKVKLAEERALLDQARAQLAAAKLSVANTDVRAPFDGVLDARQVDTGDYLKVAEQVGTVVDLDPIVVAVEVAERDAAAVRPDTPARVRLVTGETVRGTVRFIARTSANAARTFRAEIAVPNPDTRIPAGMTAEVTLETGAVTAHRVSPAVLTLNADGVVGLKVVDDEDVVRFVKGELVADTPEGLWVGGLPALARVITVGQEFVKAGQKVVAVEQDG